MAVSRQHSATAARVRDDWSIGVEGLNVPSSKLASAFQISRMRVQGATTNLVWGRADIQIVGDQIVCSVRPRDGQTLDSLIVEFRREVIDHDLRIEIRKQTEGVRNLILAHAFSKTGIVTSE